MIYSEQRRIAWVLSCHESDKELRFNALTRDRLEKLSDRRLNRFQTSRAIAISSAFNLGMHFAGPVVLRDLLPILDSEKLTSEQSAIFAWLVVKGSYPLPEEYEPVVQSVKRGEHLRGLAEAFLARGSESKVSLIQLKQDLVDVTRYSAQRRISGIPRVVKNLAFSEALQDSQLIVWEAGVPGIGARGSSGRVILDSVHWRSPHSNKGLLIGAYMRLSSRIGGTQIGLTVLEFLSTKLLPLAYRIIERSQKPTVALIPSDGQRYYLPEVPDESVSKRLLVLKRAFPALELRIIVHDVLPLTRPEFFSPGSSREHIHFASLCARADLLFVATEVLKKEVLDLLPLYSDRTLPDVKVLPLPISFLPPKLSKEMGDSDTDDEKPFFVFFGGFEKRKALSELASYLESVPAEEISFEILVLGAPWPEQGPETWSTARRVLSLPHIFKVLGTVDDSKLRDIMGGCKAVLYLSHAEGFGLPILESLAFGKPVLTQNTKTNAELASKYGGVWHEFDFSNDIGRRTLESVAHSDNPWESLGLIEGLGRELSGSVEEWATVIHRK
jgi:glycosyltransferase involved in cell wall biosynthesis